MAQNKLINEKNQYFTQNWIPITLNSYIEIKMAALFNSLWYGLESREKISLVKEYGGWYEGVSNSININPEMILTKNNNKKPIILLIL